MHILKVNLESNDEVTFKVKRTFGAQMCNQIQLVKERE